MTTRWYAARLFIFVIVGMGFPAAGGAQVLSDDPLRLEVDEAVRLAVERSEEVALAREQIEIAEAQIGQARAGVYPDVTGNLTYDRTLRSVFEVEAPPDDLPDGPPGEMGDLFADLPFGQPNTWIASLQLNQAVYTGGRLDAGMEIAERLRSASAHTLTEAESEMVRDVRQAYYETVHAASLVDIAEEAYALADEQLEQVEAFRERGTASDFEVLQARVERDNIEPQIVEAENARRLAELDLKRLLNVPQDQEVELTSPLEAEFVEVDHDAVLEAALDRPALQAAGERVRMQEEAVRVARADRRPTVSAFANFSYQAFPEQVFPDAFPGGSQWRDDWTLGVQVSVPIFDGFQTSAAIDESRSNVRVAELEREQLREGIEMEVAAAHAEYEAALAQIEARRATVAEAEEALELVELRYENGLARLIEVSNARLLLQQARSNEANALLAYISALAALEHAGAGQLNLFEP